MEHLTKQEVDMIATATARRERKSSTVTSVFTVIGGLCLPLLIWIFTAGEMYAQVQSNKKELDKREESVDAVPVIQKELESIDRDIGEIKADVEGIEDDVDIIQKDVTKILIGIEGLKVRQ